jgi:probable HAF family extracellular repeat protein
MTDLGTLSGLNPSNSNLNYSSANAINSSGIIVGWSANSSGAAVAMVYSNGQMIDLNTVTTATGGSIPGALNKATAINDQGQIVANTNSGYAFLLTPEGPATHFLSSRHRRRRRLCQSA